MATADGQIVAQPFDAVKEIAHVLIVERVVERQHRDRMRDLGEGGRRRGTNPARRAVGADQLDRAKRSTHEPPHEKTDEQHQHRDRKHKCQPDEIHRVVRSAKGVRDEDGPVILWRLKLDRRRRGCRSA